MRSKRLITIFILLALALLPAPAHAGGNISVCDEAHLLATLAGGGTVTFTCSGTIILTAPITIAADTTIEGSGQTITRGSEQIRLFQVNPGIALTLNRLTISNGYYTQAGGGGGIYNDAGTVIVNNSTFLNNTAMEGGAIYNNAGTLTVLNSTFSDHKGIGNGGAIRNYGGTLVVSNSTFTGNGVMGGGGAINNYSGAATVTNSTFAGNSARAGGGGIYSSQGTFTLKNTIVANSTGSASCEGEITDGGGNLSYPDSTCPGINKDPRLGPLQDNGGPTLTMAPGVGSSAVDAANDAVCAAPAVNNLDQRGVTRPQGFHCDIGAYEAKFSYTFLPVATR